MVAFILPLFLFLFLILLFNFKRPSSNLKKLQTRPPPSPCKLPIIGNLHQLGSLPHRSLAALAADHGPIMLLRLGRIPTLVVSSPDLAREVLRTQDHIFASRPPLTIPRRLFYSGRDVAFAPYGEYWRQVRKVSVLHLLSLKRVHSFRTIREEDVRLMVEEVSKLSRLGTPIDMSGVLNSLARDVISRAALGKCSKEERWSDVVGELIEESSRLVGALHVGDYFPGLAWISAVTGLDERVRRVSEKVDGFLEGIVEGRRSDGRRDVCSESDAFVDVLLSLEKELSMSFPFDKENIKAIVQDMFGAGIGSTYTVMEWIMAELLRNSQVMDKLKQEIQERVGMRTVVTEDDLSELSYLKAVIKETLRLHPPSTLLVPRELMEDTEIHGYDIPKQTRVLVNVWAIGRDPKFWEAPEKFWPERFLGSPIDFKGHDFQLTPFGAGRRVCPGIQFAMTITELAIANLMHCFDWSLPHHMRGEDMDMSEKSGLITGKKTRLDLVANPCFQF